MKKFLVTAWSEEVLDKEALLRVTWPLDRRRDAERGFGDHVVRKFLEQEGMFSGSLLRGVTG